MKTIEQTMKQLGVSVKTKRKSLNLSQKELSLIVFDDKNRADVISRVESGKTKEVTFFTIFKVLKGLDIDILQLIKN